MLQLLFLLALLAGLAKCWSISQRPTTNRKCVGSLMVLLVAWMASIGASWLASFPGLESLNMVLGLLPIGLAVCAALLAIAGLKDYSRSKGYYTQGQVQAISTLVVSGLLVALIAMVMFGGLLSDFRGRGRTAGGRPVVFEELNFKFLVPGGVWSQVETNPLGLKATLSIRRSRPEIYFLIVAQKAPGEAYSLDELCDLAIRNLSNAVDTLRVTYRAATSVAGQAGIRLHSEATRSGQKSYYQYKLLVFRGCTYQLIAWGAERQRIAVGDEAEYLLPRFTLLDATRGLRNGKDTLLDSWVAKVPAGDGEGRQSVRTLALETGSRIAKSPTLASSPRSQFDHSYERTILAHLLDTQADRRP